MKKIHKQLIAISILLLLFIVSFLLLTQNNKPNPNTYNPEIQSNNIKEAYGNMDYAKALFYLSNSEIRTAEDFEIEINIYFRKGYIHKSIEILNQSLTLYPLNQALLTLGIKISDKIQRYDLLETYTKKYIDTFVNDNQNLDKYKNLYLISLYRNNKFIEFKQSVFSFAKDHSSEQTIEYTKILYLSALLSLDLKDPYNISPAKLILDKIEMNLIGEANYNDFKNYFQNIDSDKDKSAINTHKSNIIRLYVNNNIINLALDLIDEVLISLPDYPAPWTYKGIAKYQDGNLSESEIAFDKAVILDNSNYLNYLYLARIKAKQNNFQKSSEYYEKSIKQSSNDVEIIREVAEYYIDQAQNRQALQKFKDINNIVGESKIGYENYLRYMTVIFDKNLEYKDVLTTIDLISNKWNVINQVNNVENQFKLDSYKLIVEYKDSLLLTEGKVNQDNEPLNTFAYYKEWLDKWENLNQKYPNKSEIIYYVANTKAKMTKFFDNTKQKKQLDDWVISIKNLYTRCVDIDISGKYAELVRPDLDKINN